ncbi:MAG: MFS transporter [Anaerovibrio sp.]|nr:MFS transporter [Anaerovibrio sp.]
MGENKTVVTNEILDGKAAKRLFLAVIITSFIGPFAGAGINVAIPQLAAEFGASANELSWVVFGFLLGSSMFILPTGKLADIFGYRRIYTIGLWLFAITFFLGGVVNSVFLLNGLRFVQGCIMSLIFGPGMALLISSHSPHERGRIIGYSAAATYSGLSLGPVICGFLCELIGWRSIFAVTGGIVLISVWLLSGIKQEWYGDKGAALDIKGSLCYLVAAPLVLCGLSEITNSSWGVCLLAAGIFAMLLFVWIESRAQYPCLDISLFRGNPVFAFSNLAAMLHYSSTFALSFLMSLYLQVILGFSAAMAGGIILFQPSVMALLSPRAGALSDKIAPGRVASVGMAITAAGLWGMSFLTEATPVWLVAALLMWIGFGFALFSSPNNNAIMGAVQPKFYGTASSLLATMRLFGQSTSMALVTMIMAMCQVHSLSGSDNAQLLSAIQTAFMIFGSISIAGIVMSLVRNKGN